MNTPPRRTRPRTPTAPRHGPTFEEYSPRRSLRLRREGQKSSPTFTNATLSPPPSSPLGQSPSPKQMKVRRKVKKATFVSDEDIRIVDTGKGKGKAREREVVAEDEDAEERTATRPTLLNPGGIGLPTPAKTPSRKRKLAPEKVANSAQALFPSTEASSSRSASRGGLFGVRRAPRTPTTPRRKSIAGKIEETSIEIFTDSDARRPKVDLDPDNPFITRPGEETRSSKRIRQKRADRLHNRLGGDSLRNDGLVYTFRGKKIFKTFENLPDREDRAASEDQDEDDVGLNPTKVKPRLLFQSPARQLILDDELKENNGMDEVDEEAETEVDEASQSVVVISSKKSGSRRPTASRMTPDSEDEMQPKVSSFKSKLASSRKVSGSKALFDEGEDDLFVAPANLVVAKARIGFSSDDEAPGSSRGAKRGLDTALGTPQTPQGKRTRRALY